jgi:hypothetical protein
METETRTKAEIIIQAAEALYQLRETAGEAGLTEAEWTALEILQGELENW